MTLPRKEPEVQYAAGMRGVADIPASTEAPASHVEPQTPTAVQAEAANHQTRQSRRQAARNEAKNERRREQPSKSVAPTYISAIHPEHASVQSTAFRIAEPAVRQTMPAAGPAQDNRTAEPQVASPELAPLPRNKSLALSKPRGLTLVGYYFRRLIGLPPAVPKHAPSRTAALNQMQEMQAELASVQKRLEGLIRSIA